MPAVEPTSPYLWRHHNLSARPQVPRSNKVCPRPRLSHLDLVSTAHLPPLSVKILASVVFPYQPSTLAVPTPL